MFLVVLLASVARGSETQTQYLSGKGKDDPIKWEFKADNGQNANKWATIGVPSNWELQGFGIYTYGRVTPPGGFPRVHGIYKRTFTTPATWRGKAIFVDFEGVMTDAEVTINGRSAGPMHQGGYYAFKYNITSLLKPAGQKNEIQVDVDDESANASVNHAERRGDFWNYGGIFRPVYLEAVPKTFIDRVAISATAAGALDVDVALSDTRAAAAGGPADSVEMQVLDLNGKPVGNPVTVKDVALNATAHLSEMVPNPRLWTAETPNLYQLEVRLKSGGAVVHSVRQRFGFRTIELRPGQGMFVNGHRVFLKGTARHSFWPDSGRTTSEQLSRDDINVMKDLNANAVRSTHYPPDRHFLDACDELGLYVLDELTGWQANYDTDIGKKLVKEMVEHDVNHPSILFWDNGNEGGFNFDLDGEFAKYDPEKRVVLHPWAAFPPGIADTKHYPNYETLTQKLAADPVFFPTEMLHGLYDGGAGAGMQDYWDAILKSKAGAGGFIWAFLDEDVKRTDKGGILDSQGNMAPDGIVGPYREREASFDTIKQLWSPIIVTPSDASSGSFTVTNRYAFLNADLCTFEWQVIAFRQPGDTASGSVVLAARTDHGRSLAPGVSASWDGWGPPTAGRSATKAPDATRLIIKDSTGRVIQTYVWPTGDLERRLDQARESVASAKPVAVESGDTLTATAGDLSLQISKTTGLLVSASRQGKAFSLANGPRVVAMGPRPAPPRRQRPTDPPLPPPQPPVLAPASKLTSLTHEADGNDLVISAAFDGPMKSLTYRLKPDGWLSIDYVYAITGPQEYFGVGFDYPETDVKGMRFLGEGPAPVYKNRLAGGTLDVWNRHYNNTMVGDPDDLKPEEHFDYPIFKGFYSGVRWLQLNTSEGPITAMVDQHPDSPIYVQIFTPKTPPPNLAGQTAVPFPNAGVSFLHAIPAVGSKFGSPLSTGPMGQLAIAKGEYKGHISLYFGKLPTQ
ncbi:MAG TPA: glycoside hydrolase family 2 TIM barrel-domain containing protein [Acidobacteriaceae bacterium]|nr:glycoside hydrolase family 2 TIM barrel-domain containing protein [Acidobacteriaceae bacterium]